MNIAETINTKIRFLVLHLHAQFSSKRISEILGVPYSTIRYWTRRTDEGDNITKITEGRGRKPVITEETKQKITRDVRRVPRKSSTRSLASKFNVSKSTVSNILAEKSYIYKSYDIPQNLTEQEKASRVTFCEEMLSEGGQRFYETFYSDEMGISLSDAHLNKVWRKEGKEMELEVPRENVRVNVWGAVSFRGATSLHILNENLNKDVYWDILGAHRDDMEELYLKEFYFTHDNQRSHLAVEDKMQEEGFGQVPFPTYSPDLNPIENL